MNPPTGDTVEPRTRGIWGGGEIHLKDSVPVSKSPMSLEDTCGLPNENSHRLLSDGGCLPMYIAKRLGKCGFVVFVGLIPVDDVPESGDVIWALVLVLEVVRMLPNIEPEHRLFAFHEGVVLVRCAHDGQLAIVDDQPSPATAKTASRSSCELLFEGIKAAKRLADGIAKFAGWLAAAVG